MHRWALPLLLVLLIGLPAIAGDEEAREDFLGHDPWLLVEEMRFEGRTDIATMIAERVKKDRLAPLLTYAEAPRGSAADAETWSRLKTSLLIGDVAALPAVVQGDAPAANTVTGILYRHARGILRARSGLRVEGNQEFLDAAVHARDLGWLDKAFALNGVVGNLGYHGGLYDQAGQAYERNLAISRESEWPPGVARSLHNLGNVRGAQGDARRARELYEQALPIQRELGDLQGASGTLIDLGHLHYKGGRPWIAGRYYREGLAIARRIGQEAWIGNALDGLGHVEVERGRLDEALAYYHEAFETRVQVDEPGALASSLYNLGIVRCDRGEYDRAVRRLELSLKLRRALRHQPWICATLTALADVYEKQARFEEALTCSDEALDICVERRDHVREMIGILSRGRLLGKLGRPEEGLDALRLAIRRAREEEDTYLLPLCMAELGAALLEGGKPDAALEGLYEAAAARLTLSTRAGRHAFESPIDVGLEAAAQLGRGGSAYAFAELGRVLFSWPLQQERERVRALDAVARAELDEARARLERTRRAAKPDAEALGEARAGLLRTVRRITWEGREADRPPPPASLERVQGWLGPHRVLVLYDLPRGNAMATVVDSESCRVVKLGKAEDVLALAEKLRCLSQHHDHGAPWLKAQAALVAPLGLASTTRSVIVSPDPLLARLPLGSLFECASTFTPSASALVREPLAATGEGTIRVGEAVTTLSDLREVLASRPRWAVLDLDLPVLVETKAWSLSAFVFPKGDDRHWIAADVLHEDIPVDLVVIRGGDLEFALVAPFLEAGARQVLCSLWSTNDEAQTALLAMFHTHRLEGMGGAEALRAAQDGIREHPDHPEWTHPFYWAGWTLWGLPD